MEPLSDVLGLLKPRTYRVHALDAGGDWALSFANYKGIKFNAIVKGSWWLRVEGHPEPLLLREGDCFLLIRGSPFELSSDSALPAVNHRDALTFDSQGVGHCGTGGEAMLISGHFTFTGDYVGALFGSLPPFVLVRAALNEASVLRWALDLFAAEIRSNQPGGSLTAEHLAHIMLIQVLRIHLAAAQAEGNDNNYGWLFALGDAQLSAALAAVHGDIARRWTLEAMAKIAGMSRSSFAEKFKRIVGKSPLEYLTSWRMHVAADRLRTTENNIASIAYEVGYESEAAFSTAFKRVHGRSPRGHRNLPQT